MVMSRNETIVLTDREIAAKCDFQEIRRGAIEKKEGWFLFLILIECEYVYVYVERESAYEIEIMVE